MWAMQCDVQMRGVPYAPFQHESLHYLHNSLIVCYTEWVCRRLASFNVHEEGVEYEIGRED
jgi:hypothetical protein